MESTTIRLPFEQFRSAVPAEEFLSYVDPCDDYFPTQLDTTDEDETNVQCPITSSMKKKKEQFILRPLIWPLSGDPSHSLLTSYSCHALTNQLTICNRKIQRNKICGFDFAFLARRRRMCNCRRGNNNSLPPRRH